MMSSKPPQVFEEWIFFSFLFVLKESICMRGARFVPCMRILETTQHSLVIHRHYMGPITCEN